MSVELKTSNDWRVIDGVITSRIDIQQAVLEEGAIVAWRTVRAAVPVSIEHVETKVDHTVTPPVSVDTYRVTLTDPLPLNHRHRVRSAEGEFFRVESYRTRGRRALLPEAEVVRVFEEPI